jgi:hypothetical protein
MSREAIVVLVDIIGREMELEAGRVMIANQRWPIPEDPGLYVMIQTISSKAIGAKTWIEQVGVGAFEEVSQAAMNDLIQIDVMSADDSAVQRKEEVLLALTSIYAEKQMEADNLQIARIVQGFSNSSALEGASMLNRFTATVAVSWLKTKRKALTEYYDTIPTPEVVPNA